MYCIHLFGSCGWRETIQCLEIKVSLYGGGEVADFIIWTGSEWVSMRNEFEGVSLEVINSSSKAIYL